MQVVLQLPDIARVVPKKQYIAKNYRLSGLNLFLMITTIFTEFDAVDCETCRFYVRDYVTFGSLLSQIRLVPCLVTLWPLCKIFLAAPGLAQNFW